LISLLLVEENRYRYKKTRPVGITHMKTSAKKNGPYFSAVIVACSG